MAEAVFDLQFLETQLMKVPCAVQVLFLPVHLQASQALQDLLRLLTLLPKGNTDMLLSP